jgi:Cu/Ag efflux protein CusF
MKTSGLNLNIWAVVCVSVLTTGAAFSASADQASADKAAATKHEKTYTGMVVTVDPKEHMLDVKEFFLHKKFNLGDTCTYTFTGKGAGTVENLRPGEKVRISYQNVNGVLVANHVEQVPMRYEGTVKSIDRDSHTVTVHLRATDKTFQIGEDCKVVLHDNKSGTLSNVQPGDHVTVTYEIPNQMPTAREIAQTSTTFTGTLTAIDLSDKTVTAKAASGSKKFNLGDNCVIVINGKTDGQLRDLKPGDKLTFSYDEVDGINVANRIGGAETPSEAKTAQQSIN